MDKKIVNYIIIGLLAVLLALFVGIYLGNRDMSTNTNNDNGYSSEINDNRNDGVIDNPILGTVEDNESLTGEKYFLMPNNVSYGNYDYFCNNNGDSLRGNIVYSSLFDATYTSDLSTSNFITIGRFDGYQNYSSLVYIKFSTYLGQYNGSELVSTTPALVTFGYEQTNTNEFILRYAFCTYGDRGEVNSFLAYALKYEEEYLGFDLKLRVPYLLSSNYSEIVHLFSLDGLTKDGYTYKLLNNESDQYYIESDVLTFVSSLVKNIVYKYISYSNQPHMDDIDLTNYIKINGKEVDHLITYYTYDKNPISLSLFLNDSGTKLLQTYFDNVNTDPIMSFCSFLGWFNNDKAIYNIPLVNIEI